MVPQNAAMLREIPIESPKSREAKAQIGFLTQKLGRERLVQATKAKWTDVTAWSRGLGQEVDQEAANRINLLFVLYQMMEPFDDPITINAWWDERVGGLTRLQALAEGDDEGIVQEARDFCDYKK